MVLKPQIGVLEPNYPSTTTFAASTTSTASPTSRCASRHTRHGSSVGSPRSRTTYRMVWRQGDTGNRVKRVGGRQQARETRHTLVLQERKKHAKLWWSYALRSPLAEESVCVREGTKAESLRYYAAFSIFDSVFRVEIDSPAIPSYTAAHAHCYCFPQLVHSASRPFSLSLV